jgi:flagellar hook assembly protein FlgD
VTSLAPVQPNPFNPSTRLAWSLAESGPVNLRIHDAAGRVVRSVVTGPQAAGPGAWVWDGRDDAGRPAASGVYYVRLTAGGKVLTQKATLVK